ncbi:MAG: zinc-binding alcohol dehydrogenase [Myxococcaceae bacterium]|nr:zinc-binding alcohol dehydrogenase [Myxococcaceae bacterium]
MTGVLGVYFQKPFDLQLAPVPVSSLGEHDVRVQTELSAISAGTEMLFYRGLVEQGAAVDATFEAHRHALTYPLCYGYSNVGRVVQLGGAVAKTLLGKRVFAFQPHQQEYVSPVSQVVVLPEGLSAEDACPLANVETAVSLLMDGAPVWGERVAIIGQGVLGTWVAGMLAQAGFCDVAVVEQSASRLALSRPMYTSKVSVFSPKGAAPPAEFDLVYELTGNPEALPLALGLCRREGRVVVGSWYGSKTASLALGTQVHRNRNTVLFSQVSHIDSKLAARFDKARRMAVAVSWLKRLPGPALITQRVPFAEAARAYELIDKQSDACLQVVLTY